MPKNWTNKTFKNYIENKIIINKTSSTILNDVTRLKTNYLSTRENRGPHIRKQKMSPADVVGLASYVQSNLKWRLAWQSNLYMMTLYPWLSCFLCFDRRSKVCRKKTILSMLFDAKVKGWHQCFYFTSWFLCHVMDSRLRLVTLLCYGYVATPWLVLLRRSHSAT